MTMQSRRQRRRVRAVLAGVLALGLHGALLTTFAALYEPPLRLPASALPTAASDSSADDDRPMEITSIVDELRAPDEKTLEEKKQEEEKKKEEEQKTPPGQVVDIARPAVEQRPEKADFLAEYDSKVDKQMRGKVGKGQAGAPEPAATAVPHPAQKAQPESAPQPLPYGAGSGAGKPGALSMRNLAKQAPDKPSPKAGETPDVMAEGPGEFSRSGAGAPAAPKKKAEQPGEQGTSNDGPAGVPVPPSVGSPKQVNLQPSADALARAIGKGPGSPDYLRDIDDGEMTALNAKKWNHAPFFNRVKRAVANEWHPDLVYVRNDPRGNVYGVKDRVTVLRVRLAEDGKLVGWTVMQSSGVEFLDEEAVQAFKRAQPFPNPPKALMGADGEIQFNFGFIFELSGRSNVKVYKYQ